MQELLSAHSCSPSWPSAAASRVQSTKTPPEATPVAASPEQAVLRQKFVVLAFLLDVAVKCRVLRTKFLPCALQGVEASWNSFCL